MDRTSAPNNQLVNNKRMYRDRAGNTPGTSAIAADRNAVQEELVSAITALGLTPTATRTNQLAAAIRSTIYNIINVTPGNLIKVESTPDFSTTTLPESEYNAADKIAKRIGDAGLAIKHFSGMTNPNQTNAAAQATIQTGLRTNTDYIIIASIVGGGWDTIASTFRGTSTDTALVAEKRSADTTQPTLQITRATGSDTITVRYNAGSTTPNTQFQQHFNLIIYDIG